jgi:hypothetical protein
MEYGKAYTTIPTLVSGKTVSQMAMEYMYGKMETNMKESGKHASDTETVLTSSQMEICM